MIIKSVYYGGMPIARVYVGGEVIWQSRDSPTELSLWYDVYLNAYPSGNVTLLPAIVMTPYHDDSDTLYYSEAVSGAALKLAEGTYLITLEQNVTSAENKAVAAPLVHGRLDGYFYVYLYDDSDGVAANVEIGNHDNDIEVSITNLADAVAADIQIGDHTYSVEVQTTHRADGVAARVETGAQCCNFEVQTMHRADGVAAEARNSAHKSALEVTTFQRADGIVAMSKAGAQKTTFLVQSTHQLGGVTAEGIIGARESAEETYSTLKGKGQSLGIVPLAQDRKEHVYNIDDSHAEVIDASPLINHEREETVESMLFPTGVRIVSGAMHSTYVCYTETSAVLSDRPEYVYPVQTDTDLYIPQVFGVTLSGTELILKPTS